MGINWSNNSSITQTRPSGFHYLTDVALDAGNHSAFQISGIPSDASIVTMIFKDFSTTGSSSGSRLHMRMGNGVNDANSLYSWCCDNRYSSTGQTEGSRNNSYLRLLHSTHTAAGHIENGVVRLMRSTNSGGASRGGWFVEAHFGDHTNEVFFHTFGRYQTNGPIDRIYLWNPSGINFDESGYIHVFYETGDGHN